MVAGHGGASLRQSVARNHAEAGGVDKAFDGRRDRSPGHGEEMGPVQAERFAQEAQQRTVVGGVFHAQTEGRALALRGVFLPHFRAHFQRILDEQALQSIAGLHLVEHALVDFLPEAGHGTHARGVHLAHALLDVERAEVDGQSRAETQTEFRPTALKHVTEGQKVHHHIIFCDVKHFGVRGQGEKVLRVEENHSLRAAGGAAGVEDVGHVAVFGLTHAALHFVLVGVVAVPQRQKLLEAQRKAVVLAALHRGVENNDVFQRVTKPQHTPNGVVLLLFAHENDAHLGVVHHKLHLRAACGGIERDAHRPRAEGAELHEERLGLVLRKHRHPVLHAHTEVDQRARRTMHPRGKLVPRDADPFGAAVVAILQGDAVAVDASRLLYESGEMANDLHGVMRRKLITAQKYDFSAIEGRRAAQ